MFGFIFGLLLISALVHIEKWLDEQDRLGKEDFEGALLHSDSTPTEKGCCGLGIGNPPSPLATGHSGSYLSDSKVWDTGKQMPLAVGEVGQIAGSNPVSPFSEQA